MFLTSYSSYLASKEKVTGNTKLDNHHQSFNSKRILIKNKNKNSNLLHLQTSYQSAVLHPPAWLSWSFHQGQRYKFPSAQLHSWLEAGDPLETDKVPTAAGKNKYKFSLTLWYSGKM